MWCTRWYLPLLLLPLPIAPPYFLVLFLFSLTLHAKPCFYCIVLLTTLLISSCYWQPLPINSPLSVPWSDNITTFAEALNATLSPNYTKPLPTRIHVLDRCWCDFSSGKFFEPFNISNWERASVQRMRKDLEHSDESSTQVVIQHVQNVTNATSETTGMKATATVPAYDHAGTTKSWFRSRLQRFFKPQDSNVQSSNPSQSTTSDLPDDIPSTESVQMLPTPTEESEAAASTPLKWFRSEYDLQPFGLGMVIDLRWS